MPGTLSGTEFSPKPKPADAAAILVVLESSVDTRTRLGSAGAEVFRRLLLDPSPDLRGHRLFELLLDVRHEPDRARHHGQPPADLPGQLELARDRPDSARGVDRQSPAGGSRRGLPDQ